MCMHWFILVANKLSFWIKRLKDRRKLRLSNGCFLKIVNLFCALYLLWTEHCVRRSTYYVIPDHRIEKIYLREFLGHACKWNQRFSWHFSFLKWGCMSKREKCCHSPSIRGQNIQWLGVTHLWENGVLAFWGIRLCHL